MLPCSVQVAEPVTGCVKWYILIVISVPYAPQITAEVPGSFNVLLYVNYHYVIN